MKVESTNTSRRRLIIGAGALALTGVAAATPAAAKTREEINVGVQSALNELFAVLPDMRAVYDRAEGALVIPEIVKAGFILAGSYGEGALLTRGGTESYWSFGAASLGFQAGAQRTRQVLFFMNQDALERFRHGDGFELGADAEVTVIEAGAEVSVDTTKDTSPVIAVVFSRQGLLGGASLEGGKYSRIDP